MLSMRAKRSSEPWPEPRLNFQMNARSALTIVTSGAQLEISQVATAVTEKIS